MYKSHSTAYVYEVTNEPQLTKTKTMTMERENLKTSGLKKIAYLILFDAFFLDYVSCVCLHVIIEKFQVKLCNRFFYQTQEREESSKLNRTTQFLGLKEPK